MYKKFKKHIGYYFSLLVILLSGLILVFLLSPNIKLQVVIVLITIFFYILWGVMHQFLNHELTTRIMIEYILVGLLGVSIMFFMIMGGLI
jgi:hypothetical protein